MLKRSLTLLALLSLLLGACGGSDGNGPGGSCEKTCSMGCAHLPQDCVSRCRDANNQRGTLDCLTNAAIDCVDATSIQTCLAP